MGAISSTSAIPVLKQYVDDPERCVRETCEIAIAKIEWDQSEEGKHHWEEDNNTYELHFLLHPLIPD